MAMSSKYDFDCDTQDVIVRIILTNEGGLANPLISPVQKFSHKLPDECRPRFTMDEVSLIFIFIV